MRRTSFWVAGLLFAGLFTTVVVWQNPVLGQERRAAAMQAWEYKIVAKDVNDLEPRKTEAAEAEINKIGTEGWELCTINGPNTNKGVRFVYYVFKRPK